MVALRLTVSVKAICQQLSLTSGISPHFRAATLIATFGALFFFATRARAQLTCSSPPCVTSTVAIGPADTITTTAGMALAASPVSGSGFLALATNYLTNLKDCYSSGSQYSESGVFISTDQGTSWVGGCQPPSGTNLGPNYDPFVVIDKNGNTFSGSLGVSSTTEGVFMQELPVGSATWVGYFPTATFTDTTLMPGFYDFDFPGVAIDNGVSTPVLYVTAEEQGFDNSTGNAISAIVVAHSTDRGSTWTTVRVSSIFDEGAYVQYPRLAVLANHHVVVTWTNGNAGTTAIVYSSVSTDKGATWSPPVAAFTLTQLGGSGCSMNVIHVAWVVPNTCDRMFYFPQLAPTHVSGGPHQVNAVYANYNGSYNNINYVSASLSGWGTPVTLASVSADQFEPCVATMPGNTDYIGVAWLDTRNSPLSSPDSLYDAYGMYSTNGGSTWSSPFRLSPTSGSTSVETVANGEYLGDWTGCTWKNGYFYFAYPSTTDGTNQVATIVGLNP